MRLIDADALEQFFLHENKRLMELLEDSEEEEKDYIKTIMPTVEWARKTVHNIKSIEPVKQEWISVKDKLPEDDLPEGSKTKRIKVLVAIKKDNGQWIIRSQTRIKDGFRYWQESGWDWGKHSYGEFTHWMPLPEPPEKEK